MSEIKQKLARARLMSSRKLPYWTTALYSLVPREVPDGSFGEAGDPDHGTIGITDQGLLIYEPRFIKFCTVQQLAAALIHEVNHWVRDHAGMVKKANWNPKIANLACDAAINDDIERMGLELPHKFLPKDIPAPDGLAEADYYDRLRRNTDFIEVSVCCGSGAGNPLPNEPRDDPKGRTPREVEDVRQATAEAIRKAAPGTVPQEMKRWAEEKLKPAKIRWEDKLARVCRTAVAFKAGAVDYRFSKPSRRQSGIGYGPGKPVLPSLVAPVPDVAVAIDTSGSMGPHELSRCAVETGMIMRAVGASITLISCDAEVHAAGKLKNPAQIAAMLKGGGGTDFRPVFNRLAKMKPRPEVLIFITDGCGPAPETKPEWIKVIWLLVGPYKQHPCVGNNWESKINWGTFIDVD